MATTHPDVAAELVGTDPTTVIAGSNRKFTWRCARGHEYTATGNTRIRPRSRETSNGCPVCSNRQVLPGFNDMATTHPDLAAELVGTDPTTVIAGTTHRLQWFCPEHPEHPYTTAGRDRLAGDGCGICKGYQIVPGYNDLATTHPDVAAELVDTDPTTITAGSHKKLLWHCPHHSEPYEASVANRVWGKGCGYCRGFQVLPGFNDMATTHPDLARELLDEDPTTVIAGAKKRRRWKCSRCTRIWSTNGDARTNNGSGCPACAPRGYDPTQPGYFYLLARHGEQQFGITSSVSRRLKQHQSKGNWDLLDTAGPFDGQATVEAERLVKTWLKTTIGRLKGTHENWSTANLEVATLHDLFTRADVSFPPLQHPASLR